MKLTIGENNEMILEMARIGWIPANEEKGIEVYVHTDDAGKTPHFHVRKYGKNNNFEWETCIQYQCAEYFLHGRYKDKLPDRKTAKELDKMLRSVNKKSRFKETYWQTAIDEWNRNNSDVEIDPDIEQPDYTKINF